MSVEHLSLVLGLRVEDSRTRSFMAGTSNYYDFRIPGYTGPKPRIVQSKMHDLPITEMLRLTYRGIERTTLSFDADLEQRAVEWSEHDRHGGVFSDPDNSRKTDIDIIDQLYTLKAVHRFNRRVKSTARFSIKDRQRTCTELLDDTPYYPGYLGDYRITGRTASLSTDFKLPDNSSLTLLYEFISEAIDTSLGGKTQNLEIHRGAGSFSCQPADNLFLVTAFMLENYDLDTPAVGVAADHARGPRPYDFRGTSCSLIAEGIYAFNEKLSCTFGFRHTEALGTDDTSGDYASDSAELMLKYACSRNQTVGLGYQFINFNSHTGDFDDYTAHALTATYAFTF
jgi:hypothetical protein